MYFQTNPYAVCVCNFVNNTHYICIQPLLSGVKFVIYIIYSLNEKIVYVREVGFEPTRIFSIRA